MESHLIFPDFKESSQIIQDLAIQTAAKGRFQCLEFWHYVWKSDFFTKKIMFS